MIEALRRVLLEMSNVLLIPVIVLLVGFASASALWFGGIVGEAIERRRRGPGLRRLVASLAEDPARRVRGEDVPRLHGFPERAIRAAAKGVRTKHVDDTQLAMEAALSRLSLGIRLGPMLGLAGTLIPLGPALVALSASDVVSLSENLVVTFTATVVGLFIGGLCFVMHAIRQRWYMRDLNDIEFVLERLD